MTAVGVLAAVTPLHFMTFEWKLHNYRNASSNLRDRRVLLSDVFLLVFWLAVVGVIMLAHFTRPAG